MFEYTAPADLLTGRVILITGAGGMFGGVLRASGIGEALTSSLSDLGMPLLLQCRQWHWQRYRRTDPS